MKFLKRIMKKYGRPRKIVTDGLAPSRLECRLRVGVLRHALTTCRYSDKAHQTFADIDALDRAIHHAVDELNAERTVLPLAEPRISAMKIALRNWRRAARPRHFHP